jgi:hypothetical protein
MRVAKALIPVLLLGCTLPARAGDRLTLRVTPALSVAPANLIIRTTVERDDANRAIEVIAESPSFFRSSEVTLDGRRAPRVTLLQFHGMPGGDYEVRAVLKGSAGQEIASSQAHISIVGDSDTR